MSGDEDHLQSYCPLLSQALRQPPHMPNLHILAGPHLKAEHLHAKRAPRRPNLRAHATPLLQGIQLPAANQASHAIT